MIVAAGAIGAVAMGSGLTAWAAWSVGSATAPASVRADALPPVGTPDAAIRAGAPRVQWTAVRSRSGQAVGGYVVTRHAGAVKTEACRVTTAVLTCSDPSAAAGSRVTYTVRAIAGTRWAGPPSPASDPVRVPGRPATSDLAAETPSPANTGPGSGSKPTGAETGGGRTGGGDAEVGDAPGGKVTEKAGETAAPVPGPATSAPVAVPTAPSPSVTGGEGGGSAALE